MHPLNHSGTDTKKMADDDERHLPGLKGNAWFCISSCLKPNSGFAFFNSFLISIYIIYIYIIYLNIIHKRTKTLTKTNSNTVDNCHRLMSETMYRLQSHTESFFNEVPFSKGEGKSKIVKDRNGKTLYYKDYLQDYSPLGNNGAIEELKEKKPLQSFMKFLHSENPELHKIPMIGQFDRVSEHKVYEDAHVIIKTGMGYDMSKVLHIVVWSKNPNHQNIYYADIDILKKMKKAADLFINDTNNKMVLYKRMKEYDYDRLAQHDFILEECVEYGFHVQPTINRLHMHVTLGPLTDEGIKHEKRWLSLDKAIEFFI